jgi:hypothetical protein
MKHVVPLMVSLVLLVGCSREQQKPEAKAPPVPAVPVAVAQPKVKPVVPPASPVKVAAQSVKPSAVPSGVKEVTPVPSGSTNRKPVSVDTFLMPAGSLASDSEAGMAFAKAQELFQQGQTNAAVDVLTAAVSSSSAENGRPVLIRKLVALLLSSGRVDDAQAACVAYAKDEKAPLGGGFIAPPYQLITQYLIEEKGDAAAAVAWTEQLATLPLSGLAAGINFQDHLTALCAAGRADAVIQSVPDILAFTNEVWSASLVQKVASDMITSSDFDNAERFLSAVEAAPNGKAAHVSTVESMRKTLRSAREAQPAAAPGP